MSDTSRSGRQPRNTARPTPPNNGNDSSQTPAQPGRYVPPPNRPLNQPAPLVHHLPMNPRIAARNIAARNIGRAPIVLPQPTTLLRPASIPPPRPAQAAQNSVTSKRPRPTTPAAVPAQQPTPAPSSLLDSSSSPSRRPVVAEKANLPNPKPASHLGRTNMAESSKGLSSTPSIMGSMVGGSQMPPKTPSSTKDNTVKGVSAPLVKPSLSSTEAKTVKGVSAPLVKPFLETPAEGSIMDPKEQRSQVVEPQTKKSPAVQGLSEGPVTPKQKDDVDPSSKLGVNSHVQEKSAVEGASKPLTMLSLNQETGEATLQAAADELASDAIEFAGRASGEAERPSKIPRLDVPAKVSVVGSSVEATKPQIDQLSIVTSSDLADHSNDIAMGDDEVPYASSSHDPCANDYEVAAALQKDLDRPTQQAGPEVIDLTTYEPPQPTNSHEAALLSDRVQIALKLQQREKGLRDASQIQFDNWHADLSSIVTWNASVKDIVFMMCGIFQHLKSEAIYRAHRPRSRPNILPGGIIEPSRGSLQIGGIVGEDASLYKLQLSDIMTLCPSLDVTDHLHGFVSKSRWLTDLSIRNLMNAHGQARAAGLKPNVFWDCHMVHNALHAGERDQTTPRFEGDSKSYLRSTREFISAQQSRCLQGESTNWPGASMGKEHDEIVFMLNQSENHWMVCQARIDGTITIYNSYKDGQALYVQLASVLLDFMRWVSARPGSPFAHTMWSEAPVFSNFYVQENVNDCGLFATFTAMALREGGEFPKCTGHTLRVIALHLCAQGVKPEGFLADMNSIVSPVGPHITQQPHAGAGPSGKAPVKGGLLLDWSHAGAGPSGKAPVKGGLLLDWSHAGAGPSGKSAVDPPKPEATASGRKATGEHSGFEPIENFETSDDPLASQANVEEPVAVSGRVKLDSALVVKSRLTEPEVRALLGADPSKSLTQVMENQGAKVAGDDVSDASYRIERIAQAEAGTIRTVRLNVTDGLETLVIDPNKVLEYLEETGYTSTQDDIADVAPDAIVVFARQSWHTRGNVTEFDLLEEKAQCLANTWLALFHPKDVALWPHKVSAQRDQKSRFLQFDHEVSNSYFLHCQVGTSRAPLFARPQRKTKAYDQIDIELDEYLNAVLQACPDGRSPQVLLLQVGVDGSPSTDRSTYLPAISKYPAISFRLTVALNPRSWQRKLGGIKRNGVLWLHLSMHYLACLSGIGFVESEDPKRAALEDEKHHRFAQVLDLVHATKGKVEFGSAELSEEPKKGANHSSNRYTRSFLSASYMPDLPARVCEVCTQPSTEDSWHRGISSSESFRCDDCRATNEDLAAAVVLLEHKIIGDTIVAPDTEAETFRLTAAHRAHVSKSNPRRGARWDVSEDRLLLHLRDVVREPWEIIVPVLTGRTHNGVVARYAALLRSENN